MGSIWRPTSFAFKIILTTSVIFLISISFSVWVHIRLHEELAKRLTIEKTKIISEFIEKNVIRAMERGRHYEIHRLLKNFAIYRGIWKINIVRPDGIVKASTDDTELDKKVADVDFLLENRDFVREEMVRHGDGKKQRERIYYYNSPILNGPDCFQCHSDQGEQIGILTVANSLEEIDEEISQAKRKAIVLAVVMLGSLSSVLGLLFLRFIDRPIKRLAAAMAKVQDGDLTVKVNLDSRDEMGRLAENLNVMIEKLNQAKKDAEQYHQKLVQRADRMASIGELASGVAHEIRNPLAGIQGAVQIMAGGLRENDSRRRVADEIQKQIDRLERLVRDLLNYAKPVRRNYLPTDINALTDKVLSFFVTQQPTLEEIKIEKKFFHPLPMVMIDPHSMEQALLNIILNAQKAMRGGGTFTISTLPLNGEGGPGETREVQIIFEDTGIGIQEEDLSKIFNPFFSTRSDGTGLGLSITKRIVEEHGGRVEVESQVHVGTKFIITLPAVKSVEQRAESKELRGRV
jgi:signal transduction histidine kinase